MYLEVSTTKLKINRKPVNNIVQKIATKKQCFNFGFVPDAIFNEKVIIISINVAGKKFNNVSPIFCINLGIKGSKNDVSKSDFVAAKKNIINARKITKIISPANERN